MQLKFFEILQRYNKALPAHLRDGRQAIFDRIQNAPLNFFQVLTAIDTQQGVNRLLINDMIRDAANEHRALTDDERARKAMYEEQMAVYADRMADTLAEFQTYKMMYPEFAKLEKNEGAVHALDNSYSVFTKGLHFELYQKHFDKRCEAS